MAGSGGWNDRLRAVARNAVTVARGQPILDRATVSIDFDDGYRSAYLHGLPAVEDHGWTATQFVMTGNPSSRTGASVGDLMGPDEVVDWSRRADVGSHTVTHRDLADLSGQDLDAELADSRAHLEDLIGRPIDQLAAPFGSSAPGVAAAASRHYRSMRLIGGPINTAASFDRWAISAICPRAHTTDDELSEHLERARHRRGWLVLAWHRIGDTSHQDDEWNTSTNQFRRQLDLIAASGLAVEPSAVVRDRLITLQDG